VDKQIKEKQNLKALVNESRRWMMMGWVEGREKAQVQ
jgi:hypothetical protein